LTNLAKILKLYLSVNEIQQKTLADHLGMEEASLSRLLQGKTVSMKSFGSIVQWLTEDSGK
jgi:DNA-binding Xre family transcriptional regulator